MYLQTVKVEICSGQISTLFGSSSICVDGKSKVNIPSASSSEGLESGNPEIQNLPIRFSFFPQMELENLYKHLILDHQSLDLD